MAAAAIGVINLTPVLQSVMHCFLLQGPQAHPKAMFHLRDRF